MHVREASPLVPESHVRCRTMACLLCVCLERGALLVGGFVPRPGRMTLATQRWALHCWRTAGPSSSLASPTQPGTLLGSAQPPQAHRYCSLCLSNPSAEALHERAVAKQQL